MGYHNVPLPLTASYRSQGGPAFNTAVMSLLSGHTERVARWDNPLHRYDIAFLVRSGSDLSQLKRHYWNRDGSLHAFPFQDWRDYSTGTNDVGTPAWNDVLISVGDGTTTQFQLYKEYPDTAGDLTKLRTVTKPIGSSVVVGVNDLEVTTGWTVDETTGIVTFSTAPGDGENVHAGFEFYVPVYYSREGNDEWLSASTDDYDILSVPSIILEEDPDGIQTQEVFNYGGSQFFALDSDTVLGYGSARVVRLTSVASAGTKLILPAAGNYPLGGPHFYIYNDDSTNACSIRDETDTEILSLAAGSVATVLLVDGTGGARAWVVF